MKSTALLLFIISLFQPTLQLHAQSSLMLPVQEKVYLHIDNNCYFLGDTLWYKAYVVLADDNSPEPLSRILYAELLNEQGYLMERQQLVVDKFGQADGCFALSDSLFAGYYEIRAYTKWMMNFGYEATKSWNRYVWCGGGLNELGMYAADVINPSISPTSLIGNLFPPGYMYMKLPLDGNGVSRPLDHGKDGISSNDLYLSGGEYEHMFLIDPEGERKNYRQYSNLFSRVFPVYSRPDSMEYYMRKRMPTKITMGDYTVRWKTPEFDVKFYPEGGTLVEGVPCRVAWEAMNQELERLNVGGLLMADGEALDTIRPMHAGRGWFRIIPLHGVKYEMVFNFGEEHFKFRLPDAEREGVSLCVEQDGEAVLLTARTRFDTPRSLTAGIYCRGKRMASFQIGGGETWQQALFADDLPEGVNQVVIHDDVGTVYADRLFFINKCYESRANVEVLGIPNRAFRPLEHIKLNLLATDAKGRPLRDETFSVSIRDADQLDPSFATGNVMTNLLLESEVRGFIEHPDFYFESADSLHRQALDLLMMVQGWRRYDWKAVDHPELAKFDYLPEQKTIVYGDVFPLRKQLFSNKLRKIQVSCTLVNLNDDLNSDDYYLYKGIIEPDTTGHFAFAYNPFYGTVQLNMKARYTDKNDDEASVVHHDPKIFLRKEFFYPQSLKAYSWYEIHQPDTIKDRKLSWEEYQDDIYASEWIPQVRIRARRRAHAKRQLNRAVFTIDFMDYLNEKWDQGYFDQSSLMDNYFDLEYNQAMLNSYVRHMYEPDFNNHEAVYMHFNWDGYTFQKAETNSFLSLLDKLWIVSDAPRRPVPYEHYHEDRREFGEFTAGVETYIHLMTYPDSIRRDIDGRSYNFQGFTHPVEFYHPDYSKAKLTEVKDYRRTLYWNPNVTTDNYGQAVIGFYNNSVCTTIDVSAEGVTKYGQFLINIDR